MTFFLLGGIVSVILSVILIIIFLVTHKIDERSIVPKIIMWAGMLFSVAGAALLTIEYSFPNVSHPKPPHVPTIYERFVEYYGEKYKEFIGEAEEYLSVKHSQLSTKETEEYSYTYFKTEVVYEKESDVYETNILNEYIYNSDFSYQEVNSKEVKQC